MDTELDKTLSPGSDSPECDPGEVAAGLNAVEAGELSGYHRLRLLGMGGMGQVFEAEEPGLQRPVAIKILRREHRNRSASVERFIREARITARIDHPNVVAVHRLGVFPEAGVYFTMTRIQGQTLQRLLAGMCDGDKELQLHYPLPRLLGIFNTAAGAVAAAHDKNIIHCDLKPENIMVGRFGEVLLLDWGVARELDAGDAGPELHPGDQLKIEGTRLYLAPELVSGAIAAPDRLTDIYALGAILYSIITLRPAPFGADLPVEELFRRIRAGQPDPIGKKAADNRLIPPEVAAICRKAMAVRREERYQTVAELLADIRNFIAGRPVAAFSRGRCYRLGKALFRHPLIPAALLAAFFAFTAIRTIEYFIGVETREQTLESAYASWLQVRENIQRAAARQAEFDNFRELPAAGEAAFLRSDQNYAVRNVQPAVESLLMIFSRFRDDAIPGKLGISPGQLCARYFYLLRSIGDYDGMAAKAADFQEHYGPLLRRAAAVDRRLQEQLQLLRGGLGRISLAGADSAVLRDEQGRVRTLTAAPIALPAGKYLLECGAYRQPVTVIPGSQTDCRIPAVPPPPPGFAAVPAGIYSGRPAAYGFVRWDIPGFYLREHPVTAGEFAEFYRTLPPAERRICRPAGADGKYLWDEEGRLLRPESAAQPVTGLSKEAVEIYCRALGRKYGRRARLPGAAEWLKAMQTFAGKPVFGVTGGTLPVLVGEPAGGPVKLVPAGNGEWRPESSGGAQAQFRPLLEE